MTFQQRISFGCVLLGLISCRPSTDTNENSAPQLVYEGMTVIELSKVLGEPDSVQTGNQIYDAASSRRKPMERWYYPKRTVVVIDDTVKVTNERQFPQFK